MHKKISFRILPNVLIINLVIAIINPHRKRLRPMVFYDHHNVFLIYFKLSPKVVYRQLLLMVYHWFRYHKNKFLFQEIQQCQIQQPVHHHRCHPRHFLNNRIIIFNHIYQLIFHFIHILVTVNMNSSFFV